MTIIKFQCKEHEYQIVKIMSIANIVIDNIKTDTFEIGYMLECGCLYSTNTLNIQKIN